MSLKVTCKIGADERIFITRSLKAHYVDDVKEWYILVLGNGSTFAVDGTLQVTTINKAD